MKNRNSYWGIGACLCGILFGISVSECIGRGKAPLPSLSNSDVTVINMDTVPCLKMSMKDGELTISKCLNDYEQIIGVWSAGDTDPQGILVLGRSKAPVVHHPDPLPKESKPQAALPENPPTEL